MPQAPHEPGEVIRDLLREVVEVSLVGMKGICHAARHVAPKNVVMMPVIMIVAVEDDGGGWCKPSATALMFDEAMPIETVIRLLKENIERMEQSRVRNGETLQ